MFGMPYFALFEVFGPVIELLGYVMTFLGLIFGVIRGNTAILFFIVSLAFGLVLSLASVLLEEFTLRKYPSPKDLWGLFAAALVESFGFRQLTAIWRVQGLIDGLQGKSGWGKMERRGFRQS
jgi:hypothetical protein